MSTILSSLPRGWFLVIGLAFVYIGICPVAAITYQPTWESLDQRPLPTWFAGLKFGIFVHWGIYSVPSYCFQHNCEWYLKQLGGPNRSDGGDRRLQDWHDATFGNGFKYTSFAPMFTAELFDPQQWAEIFKKSGAKYVVFTSKHHDGWCNYDERTAPGWNSIDAGPHRDLVAELSRAVKDTGLVMGLYHSLMEWYNPLYVKDKMNGFETHLFVDQVLHPAMRNLVRSYEPAILWTDGDWEATDEYWRSTDFLAWLYNDSPVRKYVVTGDRWGIGGHDHPSTFWTVENTPGVLQTQPWEECHTIGSSWGFNRRLSIDDYETTRQLLLLLAETVSRNGNLLLNIGPTKDGQIPLLFQDRLRDMGLWLSIFGEAIYNTTAWSVAQQFSYPISAKLPTLPATPGSLRGLGFYTARKLAPWATIVYAIFFDWPQSETLWIPDVQDPDSRKKRHSSSSWSSLVFELVGYEDWGPLKYSSDRVGVLVKLPFIMGVKGDPHEAWVIRIKGLDGPEKKDGVDGSIHTDILLK